MDNTHICLNCKTEQPKPNRVWWCKNCYSVHVTIKSCSLLGEGYIYILPDNSGISITKEKPSDSPHCIKCDETQLAYAMLSNAMRLIVTITLGTVDIERQKDYIKTIEKFENGRFYFKD